MGKKSTPKPPDLGPYADALEAQGEWAFLASQDQLEWAREQDTYNRELLGRVLDTQLPAMEQQMANAQTDRARYEQTFQPIEDQLIEDFQSYGSPERLASERGRAISDVTQAFDAQRRNALMRLESFGIDPSQTRNAALDIGMRTQQAAAQAQAGTNAGRIAEDKSRAMRADAINIGRGMPSQVASSYGQAVQAGSQAQGNANSTTATGAGALSSASTMAGLGQSGYQGAGNMMTQGFNNQMQAYNAQAAADAAMWQGIGSLAGGAMAMMADGSPGGVGAAIPAPGPDGTYPSIPGKIDYGPGDGSGIDDQVKIAASRDEYIIPADVVRQKGVEFFDKLVDRYHTPADQQRRNA